MYLTLQCSSLGFSRCPDVGTRSLKRFSTKLATWRRVSTLANVHTLQTITCAEEHITHAFQSSCKSYELHEPVVSSGRQKPKGLVRVCHVSTRQLKFSHAGCTSCGAVISVCMFHTMMSGIASCCYSIESLHPQLGLQSAITCVSELPSYLAMLASGCIPRGGV